VSDTLDLVDDEHAWRPLSSEEFRHLRRDDRLRDRGGREWTVRGSAYLDPELGEHRDWLGSLEGLPRLSRAAT
jgi:hypothetical protein